MRNRQKLWLCLSLLCCFFLMFFPWFGFGRGVQEITGTVVLFHPITIAGIVLTCIGIWLPGHGMARFLAPVGIAVILCTELYFWLFWYVETITGQWSLSDSIQGAYLECYLGMGCTLCTFILSILFCILPDAENKRIKRLP